MTRNVILIKRLDELWRYDWIRLMGKVECVPRRSIGVSFLPSFQSCRSTAPILRCFALPQPSSLNDGRLIQYWYLSQPTRSASQWLAPRSRSALVQLAEGCVAVRDLVISTRKGQRIHATEQAHSLGRHIVDRALEWPRHYAS